MLQLQITRGNATGKVVFVNKFPFVIGRASGDDLILNDDGVWEGHLRIQRNQGKVVFSKREEAFADCNGTPFQDLDFHPGQQITLGNCSFRVTLAPAVQKRYFIRERSAWLLVVFVTLLQVLIIYWLQHP